MLNTHVGILLLNIAIGIPSVLAYNILRKRLGVLLNNFAWYTQRSIMVFVNHDLSDWFDIIRGISFVLVYYWHIHYSQYGSGILLGIH